MGKIYEGQVGVVIELDTLIDLSGVTDQEIRYTGPSGEGAWPAEISGTKITYTTVGAVGDTPAELVAGTWKLQAYVEGTGFSALGETVQMTVYRAFK